MKITKRQLRKIIREAVINEALPPHLKKHFNKDGSAKVHNPMGYEVKDVTPAGYGPDEVDSYDLGREDSFAGIRPQLPDEDYMMGYNEAQADAGLPTMQAPSDSGRGKKLDPNLLKGAKPGKRWGVKESAYGDDKMRSAYDSGVSDAKEGYDAGSYHDWIANDPELMDAYDAGFEDGLSAEPEKSPRKKMNWETYKDMDVGIRGKAGY